VEDPAGLKLKLDENLSRHLKGDLAKPGFDVEAVLEEGLLGRPDTEVGRAARDEGRILLTLDLEFADLRKHPSGTHPGVILFRPRSMGPSFVN
jgi:predicted nuclease of predicted toxin-antitoxin system